MAWRGRHGGLLFSGSADRTVKIFQPLKGTALQSEAPARKPEQDLQACWGGAQLPVRHAPASVAWACAGPADLTLWLPGWRLPAPRARVATRATRRGLAAVVSSIDTATIYLCTIFDSAAQVTC